MAIYKYIATDQSGNQVDGNFEAANEQDARHILGQYNLTPSHLSEVGAVANATAPEVYQAPAKQTKTNPPKSKEPEKKKAKKVPPKKKKECFGS